MPMLANVDVTIATPDQVELPGVLNEALKYWDELRHGRWAPRWSEFNLLDLSNNVIPLTIIVDVVPEPLDFIYRFWGTANTTSQGYDCTGKSVRENKIFSEKVFNECRQICEERQPLVFHTIATKPTGLVREYTRIRLPLSEDSINVSQIVSVLQLDQKLSYLYEGDDD